MTAEAEQSRFKLLYKKSVLGCVGDIFCTSDTELLSLKDIVDTSTPGPRKLYHSLPSQQQSVCTCFFPVPKALSRVCDYPPKYVPCSKSLRLQQLLMQGKGQAQ